MHIDEGNTKLDFLINQIQNKEIEINNETETRKLIVDRILEEVLGWIPGQDIKYEMRVHEDDETTFADYSIKTATTSIIIEAKKTDIAFSIPSGKTTLSLKGVLSKGEIGNAIIQARDYARKLSVPFAAVTNGESWVIFAANRIDGVQFEKGCAVVFKTFNDLQKHFNNFWELLSRNRVIDGSLESYFFQPEKDLIQRRLVTTYREPNFRIGRNKIYEYIEPAVIAALNDESLLNDLEGLEKCYIKNSERVKFDSRIKMHLQDVKPALDRKVDRPRSRNDSKILERGLKNDPSRPKRFILLLGPVGAGKTTFLEYTKKISAKTMIDKKIVWFYIDFKKATENDNPRMFIYKELLNLIENDPDFNLNSWETAIKPAYDNFIGSRKKGTLAPIYKANRDQFEIAIAQSIEEERKQTEPYVEKLLTHTSKTFPIYIVIDNVDQMEKEEYQRTVFSEAQALARRVNSNIILSLRDSTYLKHKASPSFDAFQYENLYIDPPPIKSVLSRRFNYAKKILGKQSAEILSENGLNFKVQDLSVFFEIVAQSLLKDPAGHLIEVLSDFNVRHGLELIREFLASGHTSADHALKSFAIEGNYQFPVHEIFKGAILGQYKYFREESLQFLNIFDAKLGSFNNQLLRYYILSSITTAASNETYESTEVIKIISDFNKIGVLEKDVVSVIDKLNKARMINTTDRLVISNKSKIFPTRLGGYVIKELSSKIVYFEMCLQDSIIHTEDFWDKLRKVTITIEDASSRERTEQRIQRAKIYYEYLLDQEKEWKELCHRNGIEYWSNNLITDMKHSLEKEFYYVQKSADGNASRFNHSF